MDKSVLRGTAPLYGLNSAQSKCSINACKMNDNGIIPSHKVDAIPVLVSFSVPAATTHSFKKTDHSAAVK